MAEYIKLLFLMRNHGLYDLMWVRLRIGEVRCGEIECGGRYEDVGRSVEKCVGGGERCGGSFGGGVRRIVGKDVGGNMRCGGGVEK